jgi:hypothetical protein
MRRQMIAVQANAGRTGARRRTQLERERAELAAALTEILNRFAPTGDGRLTAEATPDDLDRWRDTLTNDEDQQ